MKKISERKIVFLIFFGHWAEMLQSFAGPFPELFSKMPSMYPLDHFDGTKTFFIKLFFPSFPDIEVIFWPFGQNSPAELSKLLTTAWRMVLMGRLYSEKQWTVWSFPEIEHFSKISVFERKNFRQFSNIFRQGFQNCTRCLTKNMLRKKSFLWKAFLHCLPKIFGPWSVNFQKPFRNCFLRVRKRNIFMSKKCERKNIFNRFRPDRERKSFCLSSILFWLGWEILLSSWGTFCEKNWFWKQFLFQQHRILRKKFSAVW